MNYLREMIVVELMLTYLQDSDNRDTSNGKIVMCLVGVYYRNLSFRSELLNCKQMKEL